MHLSLYALPFYVHLKGSAKCSKSWGICISFCVPQLFKCNPMWPLNMKNPGVYAYPLRAPPFHMELNGVLL